MVVVVVVVVVVAVVVVVDVVVVVVVEVVVVVDSGISSVLSEIRLFFKMLNAQKPQFDLPSASIVSSSTIN